MSLTTVTGDPPKRSRKIHPRSLGATGACRAARRPRAGAALGGGAPKLLPAHLPPNPASLQQRAGTTGHSRHPRSPAAGSGARRKVPSRPPVGQSPGPLGGSGLSAPPGPRGYLHGDGSHAAPGLGRALLLEPSGRSAAGACSRPGPLPGGGAGRLEGGGEGRGNQSGALEPRGGRVWPRRPSRLGLR